MTTLKWVTGGCLGPRLTAGVGAVLLCLVEPVIAQVVVSGTVTDQGLNPIREVSLLIENSSVPWCGGNHPFQ